MNQNLTYVPCGDYFIPDIKLSQAESHTLGKYGRMRRVFLEQNNPMLLNDLILTESLFSHLWETEDAAKARVELLMKQYLEQNPAPDKVMDQMGWVQHMNTLKSLAEEVVVKELIYC